MNGGITDDQVFGSNLTNSTVARAGWSPDVLAASAANCSSVVTEAELDAMIQLVHGMIIPILAGVGIILNILNLVVLSSGKLKESSYTYLTGLAVADGSMLVLFFINGIGRGNFPHSSSWRVFEAYLYFPCGFVMAMAGALLTVTVSMERYFFIYKPLTAKACCHRRTARIITAIIWTTCVAMNIPRFFVFEVNRERGKLEYTDFGRSMPYKYMSWFHLLFISCGCGLALIVLNILLILGLRRNKSRRRALGARRNVHTRADDHRLTRTLISIVFIFLMGEIPSALTSRALVVGLSGDLCTVETKAFKVMSLISTVLIVLQLSLNFVVYCVLNRRFWAVFKAQLCPCSRCQNDRHLINNNQPRDVTSANVLQSKSKVNGTQENGLAQ